MPQPDINPEFEALLDYLKHNLGCDLTGYKRSTLQRRFEHRMQNLNLETYEQYLQYLQSHPREPEALLQDVLINFTGFFRDRHAWAYLMDQIMPQILAQQQADEPIRIWSAGCASGQEIYTLLILLIETLGFEFCRQHMQFYGTDADAEALQQARLASYYDFEVIDLSADLLAKYFEQSGEYYVLRPELRSMVTFEQHNLVQDQPLPAIDLLLCRNVLMYFTSEAQTFILQQFRSVLKDKGFLFVGTAEMLFSYHHIFTPVNLSQRVYTKSGHGYTTISGSYEPSDRSGFIARVRLSEPGQFPTSDLITLETVWALLTQHLPQRSGQGTNFRRFSQKNLPTNRVPLG